jgi:hypothetical protein
VNISVSECEFESDYESSLSVFESRECEWEDEYGVRVCVCVSSL